MRKRFLFITGWLLITIIPVSLFSQSKIVTGQITVNNIPVVGATIAVNNSAEAVASDADGKFSLSVPQNAVLTVSATGYKTQTVKADNTSLQITLTEDVARLDEITVTGLATSVKRRNLANAVATITSKQLNEVAPAQTFDAALEGKISGAYINSNSGAPGGGSSVRLRGVTSIYGNTQPLYVVDGVFMNNAAVPAGLNTVTAASAGGNSSNQDNPSNRIADLRPEAWIIFYNE